MDRKSLLKEVNRLVSSGLRKSAIDLINEYLESTPHDSFVFRALGRIYLLEKKPDQAIKYLQLALKSNHAEAALENNVTSYVFDTLDHDDLSYIDESSSEEDLDYSYDSENEYEHGSKPIKSFLQKTNHLIVGLFESEVSDNQDEHNSDHEVEVRSSPENSDDFENTEVIFDTSSNDDEFSLSPEIDDYDDPFKHEVIALTDLDDEIEDDDIEEAFVGDEVKSIEDEFDWDGLEDFDEIDEPYLPSQFSEYEVKTEGKISRLERAGQVASEVIQSYDWGIKNLPLLQQVFYENGWAAARVAIEHELSRGLTPNELELAIFVRRLWTENQQYWISFIHITSKQPFQETRAAYKCMSWREALRIVRAFNNLPSEEEIQLFVDEVYDDWYCSQNLQKQHKAFIRYLKYRTGSVRHTLPGNELFSFVNPYEQDALIDLPLDIIKCANAVAELKHQGIDIENMMVNLEQKYNIAKSLNSMPYSYDEDVISKNTKRAKKNIDEIVEDEDDETL